MPQIEPQLDEWLSAFLDGELTTEESATLTRRIESDPDLAGALEALRAERNLRAVLWRSNEPDDSSVQRLITRVDAAVDRHTTFAYRLSRLRIASAAAACVLLGVLIGRASLNSHPTGLLSGADNPTVVQGPAVPGSPVGTITNVNAPIQQYRIMGPDGRPVEGIRAFNSIREAQQFLDDMRFWQQEQERIKNGGSILPSDSEKF